MRKCNHVHDTPFKRCPKCRSHDAEKKKKRDPKKRARYQSDYLAKKPWVRTYGSAKARAKEKGLPFDITREYLQSLYGENDGYCPVLKVPITADNPLSIDRIHPHLGYVRENIRLISFRANTLKNNATVEELRLVLRDLESIL